MRHRKLTSVGADFFGWTDGGRGIGWALGTTWYRRPLAGIALDAPGTPLVTRLEQGPYDAVSGVIGDPLTA